MAQSRKDSRGYALRSGECQRSDGRYSYSYTDKDHNHELKSRQFKLIFCTIRTFF